MPPPEADSHMRSGCLGGAGRFDAPAWMSNWVYLDDRRAGTHDSEVNDIGFLSVDRYRKDVLEVSGKTVGYVRVSAIDQNPDRQVAALGCEVWR
ncbi:hypothetical protein GCM10009755_28700 [Brevibacterium samyangense]|uniref:Resolvase/invertase-type recombinase catalytic domain-containing protein n=1 Tax=Brevibacterium samyangense TaxID=366888 RepID=A0ABN2TNQ8_9MICO